MDETETQIEWSERFTLGVARQIKHYREAKNWSFQQLADACTDLGYRTIRTTLANLENGRRKSITVHEMLVIAEALEVPAVQLLFPGLPDSQVEYLPGRTSRSWEAIQRFTGETSTPGAPDVTTRNMDIWGLRTLEQVRAELAGVDVGIQTLPNQREELEKRRTELLRTRFLLVQNLRSSGYTIDEDFTYDQA